MRQSLSHRSTLMTGRDTLSANPAQTRTGICGHASRPRLGARHQPCALGRGKGESQQQLQPSKPGFALPLANAPIMIKVLHGLWLQRGFQPKVALPTQGLGLAPKHATCAGAYAAACSSCSPAGWEAGGEASDWRRVSHFLAALAPVRQPNVTLHLQSRACASGRCLTWRRGAL